MKVKVRFFATLRERVGANEITKEVEEGCTVGKLWDTLQQDHPKLAPVNMKLLYAVNKDYVGANHILRDMAEVVFVPPISVG